MNKTRALIAALTAGLLIAPALPAAETAPPPQAVAAPEAPPEEAPDQERPEALRFESPDAAAMALIDAAATEGGEALYAVLGPDLEELLSGDPVSDAADRRWFVENAQKAADIEDEETDSAILVIGPDDWPFPIPLAKDESGWYFDTEAGIEEVLDRRVGRNELYTIASMRAFVDAEREYAAADPDGDGTHAYADRILSTTDKKDGLYWPTKEGDPESPLGPLVAEAVATGYSADRSDEGPRPFHGYFYKVLTAQGDRAPGGARSYLKDGRLTEGFALVAWPASYGSSGIMTFQVNQKGMVYEKDLGEETAMAAAAIDAYNPGEGWQAAVD
jgi:hypothetical protein